MKFVATKKNKTANFFPSFVVVGSGKGGTGDQSGMDKNQDPDKHPGSATLHRYHFQIQNFRAIITFIYFDLLGAYSVHGPRQPAVSLFRRGTLHQRRNKGKSDWTSSRYRLPVNRRLKLHLFFVYSGTIFSGYRDLSFRGFLKLCELFLRHGNNSFERDNLTDTKGSYEIDEI